MARRTRGGDGRPSASNKGEAVLQLLVDLPARVHLELILQLSRDMTKQTSADVVLTKSDKQPGGGVADELIDLDLLGRRIDTVRLDNNRDADLLEDVFAELRFQRVLDVNLLRAVSSNPRACSADELRTR